MTKTYETMLLLDNREVKKGWDACKTNVCGLFEKHQAEVVSAKRWDELRLGFPIKRQLRGTYLLMYFNAEGSSLPSIRRELEYNEVVLRHLTMVCEEIPQEAKEPEAEFDLESIRVEETAIDAPAPAAEEAAERKGGKDSEGKDSEGKEAKAEEAKAEEAKAEEAKAEDAPAEETKAEAGDAAPEAASAEEAPAADAKKSDDTEGDKES